MFMYVSHVMYRNFVFFGGWGGGGRGSQNAWLVVTQCNGKLTSTHFRWKDKMLNKRSKILAWPFWLVHFVGRVYADLSNLKWGLSHTILQSTYFNFSHGKAKPSSPTTHTHTHHYIGYLFGVSKLHFVYTRSLRNFQQ